MRSIRGILRRLAGPVRNEDGATIVFVAVSMVAMLAIMALAIDLGLLFVARSEAQRAADSAALAGASAFVDIDPALQPDEAEDLARSRVIAFAQQNTVRNAPVEPEEVFQQYMLPEYKVRVTIRRAAVPLFFASIFSIDSWPVAATAAAVAANAGATNCVKPFAIPDLWMETEEDINGNEIWDFDRDLDCNGNNCQQETWGFDQGMDSYDRNRDGYGTDARNDLTDWRGYDYQLDDGRRIPLKINTGGDASVASYWFPWVIPDHKRGTKTYTEIIKSCVDLTFRIGDQVSKDSVETKNGNTPKPTWDAITQLIDDPDDPLADPGAYWDDRENRLMNSKFCPGNDPSCFEWRKSNRVITVAVFNPEDMDHGKTYMRFVDFGQFFLEDPRVVYANLNPNHKAPITGRLLRFASGDLGPDQGRLSRVLRLVE